jgi:DNA-binding IclR family transcriptional regulator
LTLERKVELLEEIDKGERSKRQIAEEFGIAPSTLSGIIVNRER